MKHIFLFLTFIYSLFAVSAFATISNDSITYHSLDEVTVTSLYRSSIGTDNTITFDKLVEKNHGQGVDYMIATLPNIFAYNDNGTQMGYTYFRLRGMGQERMNITLDGMPWNENEDFGCYFSNSPDLMGSMHSIKVENGSSVTTNGTAAYAGNVSLESVNLATDTLSYAEIGGGSFNSYRASVVYNMGIKNKWGFHIRGTQQQTDGYRKHSSNNSQALTIKLGYFFNENHSLDILTMNGFHRNGQGYLGVPMSEFPKHLNPFKQIENGCMPTETDDFFTTYNRLQYKGRLSNNLFLTSSLYWNHQNGNYRISWLDETAPSGKVLNNYDLVYNTFGFNVTAKWYILDNLSLIGGVNANTYKRTHKGYDIENTDEIINIWHSEGMTPYYINEGIKPDMNVSATLNYTPFNKFNIKGSVQYRMTSLDYKVKEAAYGDVENDIPFKHTWNFVNYSLGIDYNFNKNNTVYAKYAVTNREPSRTDLFGGEYRMADSPLNTKNERVNDVEFGYAFHSTNLSLDVNAFYMHFDNELVATGELSPINCLPLHTQINSQRYGLEMSFTYNPFKTFNLLATASLSHNKLNDIDKTCTFSPTSIIFGEINYTFGTVKVGVNTHYRSKMYIDVENLATLKPMWTLNAYVNAPINKIMEVGLNLNNITNRLNISNGSFDGDTAYYIIDSPFSFFATCKFKF